MGQRFSRAFVGIIVMGIGSIGLINVVLCNAGPFVAAGICIALVAYGHNIMTRPLRAHRPTRR